MEDDLVQKSYDSAEKYHQNYSPPISEAIKRGWDWVVFVVKLISRIGGLQGWMRAIRRLMEILRSRQSEPLDQIEHKLTSVQEFYDISAFPTLYALELNWQDIQQELRQLQPVEFIPWSEKYLYKNGWTTFAFFAFGIPIDLNCQLCPKTTAILKRIPNLVNAAFSSLAPSTHITPHTGYPEGVLRCHLGLIVPENCGIRVGTHTRTWVEGKCLIFDDTFEHEAWNKSDHTRVVLLLDFKYSPQTSISDES